MTKPIYQLMKKDAVQKDLERIHYFQFTITERLQIQTTLNQKVDCELTHQWALVIFNEKEIQKLCNDPMFTEEIRKVSKETFDECFNYYLETQI